MANLDNKENENNDENLENNEKIEWEIVESKPVEEHLIGENIQPLSIEKELKQ